MYIFANEGILNDVDGDGEDLELDKLFEEDPLMIIESIAMAVDVIDKLSQNVAVLESAARTTDDVTKRQLLQISQLHRSSVMNYYRSQDPVFSSVVAVESVGNLVYALEEEAATEKGLISKMIDAVKNAFKWLWEKITGIFKSTETNEEAKKAAANLSDLLEKAVAKKDEIPENSVIEKDTIGKAFAGLGESVDIPKIIDSIVVQKTASDVIKGLVIDMVEHLSKANGMVDSMTSGGKDPMEVYTEFANQTSSSIAKHMKNQLQADQVNVYKFASDNEGIDVSKSYIVGDYIAAEGPSSFCVFWSVGKDAKSQGRLKAGFRVRGSLSKTAKITLPGKLSDLKPLAEKITELSDFQSKSFEEAQKMNPENKAKEFQSQLEGLKSKFGDDQKDAAAKVKTFVNYANGVGAVMTGTVQFLKAMDSAVKVYRSVVEEAIKLSASIKTEEKKEGDKEAPAGDAAPADGGKTVVQQEGSGKSSDETKAEKAETAPAPAA